MTPMLTEAELLELERLEREATPAERWFRDWISTGAIDIRCAMMGPHHTGDDRVDAAQRDADLVVAARNALPSLIAAYRERDELRRQVEAIRKFVDKPPRDLLVPVGVLRHIISATEPKGEP